MKKLLIILPSINMGGIFDYTIRFCECLSRNLGDDYQLTFCYPNNKCFDGIREIAELDKLGVSLKRYDYGIVDDMCHIYVNREELSDYDFAFVMSSSSPLQAPLFLPIKHAVVAHDFIEKYVPEVFSDQDLFVKHANESGADFIIVTTEPTYNDARTMDHLKLSKIILTPVLLKMEDFETGKRENCIKEPYFLWSTNTTQHKNHRRAIDALEKYYLNGGKLACVITGACTRLWRLEEKTDIAYVNEVKNKMHSKEILSRNIRILGNLPKSEYSVVLKNARFVFHPGYGDNGNGTVFDAASVGVPSLVSDYAAMHYLSDYASIRMKFFDYTSSDDMCNALLDMEKTYTDYKNELPTRKELELVNYKEKGGELCEAIKGILLLE